MKKKLLMLGSAVLAAGVFSGCGTTVNLSDYQNSVKQPIVVPDVCQAEYNKLASIPKVAVVKFTNNSSFGKANTTTSNRSNNYQGNAVAGVVTGENGAAMGVVSKGHLDVNTHKTTRIVDPKLDKAIRSALEGKLTEMGGADIYSRDDLNKVMKEQKLQQSGLMDENTLVKVGKLAGVRYIVTGSIDSVTQEYKDYEKAANVATQNSNQNQSLVSILTKAAINAGASAASGMKITTKVTFKVIDVETGKIIASIQKTETTNIGKIPNPTYTQIIGGIKDDIMQAVDDSQSTFSKIFPLKGYILQVNTNKDNKDFIAEINLGSKDKVKPEQTFKVYNFAETTDPVTHKVSCDKYALNVELVVSKNQIESHRSWTKADGDDANKLRPGMIIKRDAIKKSLLSF